MISPQSICGKPVEQAQMIRIDALHFTVSGYNPERVKPVSKNANQCHSRNPRLCKANRLLFTLTFSVKP